MKKNIWFSALCALAVCVFVSSFAVAQDAPTTYRWSLWLGSHYTGFTDFVDRVGEYNRGHEEAMPEVKFSLGAEKGFQRYEIQGHFYNPEEIDVMALARVEDQLKFVASYKSLSHRKPTDLLGNLIARESTNRDGTQRGGKMVTHVDNDPGAEYGITRHEINTELEYTPREVDWLKLSAAHRSILEKGDHQSIASMHCATCHMESNRIDVDEAMHSLAVGADVEQDDFGVGYQFDFRTFKSNVTTPSILYDTARHPVNGGNVEEFGSRVSFDGEDVQIGLIPEVKKMAHALRGRVGLGPGTLLGRVSTQRAKNENNGLETVIYAGTAQYATVLSPQVNLRAKVEASDRETDDVFIDLDPWREGRGGGGQNFDYTRYSTFTGRRGGGEAEITFRPDRKTRLAGLIGYEGEQREDYPTQGYKHTTSRVIGQLKARHRASSSVNLRGKYRLEVTDDPFTNFKGLFERVGNDILEQNSVTGLAYYYQREALKTGNITTEPTQGHYLEAQVSLSPDPSVNFSLGGKLTLEKNDDLDSLEYERTAYQPSISATLIPDPVVSLFGSFTYLFDESNGPMVVALFDG